MSKYNTIVTILLIISIIANLYLWAGYEVATLNAQRFGKAYKECSESFSKCIDSINEWHEEDKEWVKGVSESLGILE